MAMVWFDSRSPIAGNNVCVNTWHVQTLGAVLTSEANAMLAAVSAFYNAQNAYRVNGTSFTTGTRVLWALESWWTKPVGKPGASGYVKGFWNTPPTIVPAASSTSAAGTGTGQLPPQLACVVSWRTATSGRSGRGRTYLGNLAAAAMSGAVLYGPAITAINNGATALIAAIAGITTGGGPAALSVWSPTTGLQRPVLTGASDTIFDTMRSRVK
jgi:hypothetical protein